MNNETVESLKISQKKLALWVAAAVLATAVISSCIWWFALRPEVSEKTAGNTKISSSPVPSPATENISEPVRVEYGGGVSKQMDATISFTAPVSWRTLSFAPAGDAKTFCSAGVGNEHCLKFDFADSLGSPTSVRAANNIQLYNLSEWRSSSAILPDQLSQFAGTTDPQVKQSQIAATEALTSGSQLNASILKNLFNPFSLSSGFQGISDVKYVQSADGFLKGYSYVASWTQNPKYAPQTFVVLVGESKGVTVAVSGIFNLNDALRKSAPSATDNEFFTKYNSGSYEYPSDTLKLNDQAVAVMKTLRFDFN